MQDGGFYHSFSKKSCIIIHNFKYNREKHFGNFIRTFNSLFSFHREEPKTI